MHHREKDSLLLGSLSVKQTDISLTGEQADQCRQS